MQTEGDRAAGARTNVWILFDIGAARLLAAVCSGPVALPFLEVGTYLHGLVLVGRPGLFVHRPVRHQAMRCLLRIWWEVGRSSKQLVFCVSVGTEVLSQDAPRRVPIADPTSNHAWRCRVPRHPAVGLVHPWMSVEAAPPSVRHVPQNMQLFMHRTHGRRSRSRSRQLR